MKGSMILGLAAVASLGIASSAMAVTATGAGGVIPAAGTGGTGAVWPLTLPASPYASTVVLPIGVASVNSVTLTSLSHTWIGDVHVVLFNPAGVGFNLIHRIGFTGVGAGASGDFGATYVIADGGAAFPAPTGAAVIAGGTYAPHFGTGGGMWTSGTAGIMNSALSGVSGGSGAWTLRIYDWVSADVGSIGSWTIDYNEVPAPGALALLGLAGLASRRRRA